MKKKKFSEADHVKAGTLLKQAYESIQTAEIMFLNSYPKNNEISKLLIQAKQSLLAAKDKADDLFCGEYPNSEEDHVYFGKRNSTT